MNFAGFDSDKNAEFFYRAVNAFINGVNKRYQHEIGKHYLDAIRKQSPATVS